MITGNLETQFLPREVALKEALVSANFSPATWESNTSKHRLGLLYIE